MSNASSNIKKYPYNLSVEKNVLIQGDKFTVFNAYFSSIYDLYNYLKSEPELNRDTFYRLSSVTGSSDFAGKDYEKSLEDLISPLDDNYDKFLSLQGDFSSAKDTIVHRFQREYDCVGGGDIDYARLSSQDPNFYVVRKRISEPKFITLYVALSYVWSTRSSQVWNRALAISNIVRALEDSGYTVAVEAFELSQEYNEAVCITVNLKNQDSSLDLVGLYKSLCHVEFLRRILFRVLETLPVGREWGDGYGVTSSESFVREYLNLDSDVLYFDQPREMGVSGKDVFTDFSSIVNHLGVQDQIDLGKAEFEYNNMVLSKTRKNTL